MNTDCFEIGMIQAFMDGEASPELAARIANHAADCEPCAKLLAEAEEQNAMVFAVLERELDAMVPTQRLWNRINESIAETRDTMSIFGRFRAFAAFYVANPSLASALSLLIVFGIAVVLWNMRGTIDVSETGATGVPAGTRNASTGGAGSASGVSDIAGMNNQSSIDKRRDSAGDSETSGARIEAAVEREPVRPRASLAVYRTTSPPRVALLPGERVYLDTIAGLSEEFDASKDRVLPPSARVSLERDLAVVDDAIRKMRGVVKRNPDNLSARQVLYASYQDKIDLLNSVALRDELASVR